MKFNASISTLGIQEAKVQQAIMKLLENSLWQREKSNGDRSNLEESLRRMSQKMATVENTAFCLFGQHFTATDVFSMPGLVSDANASYNVKVTFYNKESTQRNCLVNGTTVSLESGAGKTASAQVTVSGSGSFTIDNAADTVNVFVRIWR